MCQGRIFEQVIQQRRICGIQRKENTSRFLSVQTRRADSVRIEIYERNKEYVIAVRNQVVKYLQIQKQTQQTRLYKYSFKFRDSRHSEKHG